MKQVRKNRLLAWVLACAMIAGLLPAVSVPVLAAEESHVHDPAALVNGVCSCGAEEPIEVEIPEGLNLERISPVTAIEHFVYP